MPRKYLSNRICAYLLQHPTFLAKNLLQTGGAPRHNLQQLLEMCRALGHLQDHTSADAIRAPPGKRADGEYTAWAMKTRRKLAEIVVDEVGVAFTEEDVLGRLRPRGNGRTVQLVHAFYRCSGNAKRATEATLESQLYVSRPSQTVHMQTARVHPPTKTYLHRD